MDLRLFFRVVYRFRVLVAAGSLVALIVTFLSFVRLSSDGISYREPVIYQSDSTLFVTQGGFPWGRVSVDPNTPPPDPNRFASLAIVYSQFANSDAVRRLVHPTQGAKYKAVPVPAEEGGGVLPFIEIQGTSKDPRGAEKVAAVASSALRRYIDAEQQANGIAPDERIVLQVLARPTAARVATKPSITRPLFVFLLMMTLVLGLAFVLENLRPRVVLKPVSASPVVGPEAQRAAGRGSVG